MRRKALEEIEQAPGRAKRRGMGGARPPIWNGPDPVFAEVASGLCGRELADARDDLDRARLRYAAAVRAGRVAGYSWAEIGRLLGVSKQSLHRRYGALG